MEVKHVTQTAVCQGRAEDGDVVLVRPVIDGALIVDLLTQTVDDFRRGPVDLVLSALAGLLLLKHLVEDGHHPILKGAVVGVRHNEVADPVQALFAERSAVGAEGAHVCLAKALDEVFLYAASGGDDTRDVFVLY